ncbi:MAG TPA: WYL domain-containing protein [Actinomycetes bacterium]
MSQVAAYAKRLAALPRALAILELHPQGLPLADLAGELGVRPEDLREVVMAYYLADLVELGNFGQPVVEFFAPDADDEEVDPATAQWVRVVARDPEQELGVDHLSAEQLGRLFEAGADLLALEPENATLRSALEAFQSALWPVDGPAGTEWKATTAQQLHKAVQERRRVRISYVRQWHPGAGERVIEPYRLVRTRRGWEVDAGPADEVAAVRTFLVSGISTCEVLDETFQLPADVDELLTTQRTPVTVELVVPQDRRWAVDRYSEAVTVLADDEESVSLRAELLPPVAQRLGLLLLCCGPDAFVMTPLDLADSGADVARVLLEHHRGRA